MSFQDWGGNLPPELALEHQALMRRQKIADAMMADSQRSPQGRMAGRFYVAPSPFEGAAQLMSAYAGTKIGKEVDKGSKDLGTKYNEGLAGAVQNYMKGGEREVQSPDFGAMTGGLDSQDVPMQTETIKADPRERLVQAMTSPYAPVRQLGTMDFNASLKERELADNRAFRTEESQRARDARSADLEANRAAQAERVRQEQAFRDQQARQAALDRENLARVSAGLAASNRPEKMVTVIGPDGSPVSMPQSQATGMTLYTPAAAKAIKDAQAKEGAKKQLNETVGELKSYYDALKEGGGIVSQNQGTLGNIASRMQSSGVGQTLGGAVGTRNQEQRQKIEQTRPLLMNLIKNATGMSAQQMNSNAEMQLYLRAATDPTLSYEANIQALDNLDKLFGLGLGVSGNQNAPKGSARSPQDAEALAWANANPNDPRSAAIKQRLGAK